MSPYIYRPGGTISTIFIQAEDFNNVQGSTSRNNFGQNWNAFKFDAAAQESAAATIRKPSGWLTATATLYWAGDSDLVGDVFWKLDHHIATLDDGYNTSAAADEQLTATPTHASGDWRDVKTVSLGTLTFGAAGTLSSLVVVRQANDASDTYGGDAGILGLLLSQAS